MFKHFFVFLYHVRINDQTFFQMFKHSVVDIKGWLCDV